MRLVEPDCVYRPCSPELSRRLGADAGELRPHEALLIVVQPSPVAEESWNMMKTTSSPRPAGGRWVSLVLAGVALGSALLLTPVVSQAETYQQKANQEAQFSCSLLDDASARARMDGLLRYLLIQCGRENELGQVENESEEPRPRGRVPAAVDTAVSSPVQDTSGTARTQSETSISRNPVTGTICAAWNDSFHGVTQNQGFSGFGRSTDNGLTFTDFGPISGDDSGDPSLVWRKIDGKFYYAALRNGGLGLYRSDDDCQSFVFVSQISNGNDDKEIMAVDNNVASPGYGNLYVVWTDFGVNGQIFSTRSTDAGATWGNVVALSANGDDVQGAWPVVASNGDVFAGWVKWQGAGFPNGDVEVQIARSTNQGVAYSLVTPPVAGQDNPRDNTATGACGRPALKGNVRYLPSPQIAVGPGAGVLHAVYTYDPDGNGTGDVVSVFYRRSTDNGATWGPEVLVNDDGGTNDQYQPAMAVSEAGVVTIGYYDRRNDPANTQIEYFIRQSFDNGVTWSNASVKLSDVPSPIVLDPNLATCYHGDYDTMIAENGFGYPLWSDDRGGTPAAGSGPDIYTERFEVGTNFLVIPSPASASVCVPTSAVYNLTVPQFQGFNEAVTLSATGNPSGSTVSFGTNPVTPPGSSTMTIATTGVAAGSSTITITGTSSPSSIVQTSAVTLNLFDITPGAPTLTAPSNNAVGVPLLPTLTWTAATQATSYDVQVATDAGFSSIVFSATVNGTSANVTTALNPLTGYFWRVRSSNVCGTGTFSSAFQFTTADIPPFLLVDDDDNGPDVRPTLIGILDAAGLEYDIWDTANSDNEPTAAQLAPYRTVIWFTGDEFGGSAGPGAASETELSTWLNTGARCLFLDSQDYLFDRGVTAFGTNFLGIASRNDDEGHTSATGANFFAGLGPFGLTFPFTNFSDVVTPNANGTIAFNGTGGTTTGAASVYRLNTTAGWATVTFTIPLEAFPAAQQGAVFQRVLDLCGQVTDELFEDGFESGNTSAWTATVP
jgi:hypothetical protein